jgi:predicted DNA-binding ribbon-helix-helix protein
MRHMQKEFYDARRRPLMEGASMKSVVVKRSIVVAGHKTSVSLEDAFWHGLKEIVRGRRMTLSEVLADIDNQRHRGNLSSTIRLFVLDHYRSQASAGPRPGPATIMAAGTPASHHSL